MPRSSRLEVPGGIHHVTARGNRRSAIFVDDHDRSVLLAILAGTLSQFDAEAFAYCLMGNHYHFVLHTRQANLSALMARVNGSYAQAFNRRHGLTGSLFEGRFKSIHADEDAYLLSVCRYVELNPVRAGLATAAGDWSWSSHRASTGRIQGPPWLATHRLLEHVTGRPAHTLADRHDAHAAYAAFVAADRGTRLWEDHLREGRWLGDDAFVAQMRAAAARRSC